ncbi:hypothetical protein FM076_31300 [Streptomyces albus subsp. chlorinus]|uniref:YcaO-like family protein n=1 Tax=Streptomyces albus TaxID=1888 RepID=UPI00156E6EA9|nr:YcaO-like family protein [Streptomyces albus]NSC25398.1 hypothetical protein [Streptomyces albus subsp. chlorinus]
MTLKTHSTGTHRVRTPEETWRRVEPVLGRYGISRLADVTGLDHLGVPVYMAIRPLAQTLSVSQGKGLTPLLARISAAMESIELWYAENCAADPEFSGVPSGDLSLPYSVRDLDHKEGSLLTPRSPLEWVVGEGLLGGDRVPVPYDSVHLSTVECAWSPVGLSSSSNGLASGNCVEEAAVHALYELIERDALAHAPRDDTAPSLALDSVTDPAGRALIEALLDAGAQLRVRPVPNRWELPCFSASLWTEDFPSLAEGYGAHAAPSVALCRAVTEAAQSRLTSISGTRDDLLSSYYELMFETSPARPASTPGTVPWDAVPQAAAFLDVAEEMVWLAGLLAKETEVEPVLVTLAATAELSVVKVIAPTLGNYRH